MISFEQARQRIEQAARLRTLGTSVTDECLGRYAAVNIVAPESVPSFDNSAMDGFTLDSRMTLAASPRDSVRLKVDGCVVAGDDVAESGAQSLEIMTGAPMPAGRFDAVVKIEDVKVTRDSSGRAVEIELRAPVARGQNVRGRGEDFREGQPVLSRGTRIMPQHLMALASLGLNRVPVREKARVAVLSTGRELIDAGAKELAKGMIRNSTAPYLLGALALNGVDARFYGTIPDEPELFRNVLSSILRESPDVILTTGAVSMGKHDFVARELEAMGASILFHKTAIRPGKPLLFAEFADGSRPGPVVFGIPGNPVSTSVGLRFFVEPYLRSLMEAPPERPVRARLAHGTSKPEGLRCFFKSRLELDEKGARVEVLTGQASFLVSPLLAANSWAVLREEGNAVAEGTVIDVYPLHALGFDFNAEDGGLEPKRYHKKECCR